MMQPMILLVAIAVGVFGFFVVTWLVVGALRRARARRAGTVDWTDLLARGDASRRGAASRDRARLSDWFNTLDAVVSDWSSDGHGDDGGSCGGDSCDGGGDSGD